jgi:hypothetical protein
MSETVCIHGLPVDPYPIHCEQCEREFPPVPLPVSADIPKAMRERYEQPLPPVRVADPERLLDLQDEEEEIDLMLLDEAEQEEEPTWKAAT